MEDILPCLSFLFSIPIPVLIKAFSQLENLTRFIIYAYDYTKRDFSGKELLISFYFTASG